MTLEKSRLHPTLTFGPATAGAPARRGSRAGRAARSSCGLLWHLTALFAVATCSAIVLTSPRFHLTDDAMVSTTAPWAVWVAPEASGRPLTPGSAPQSITFRVMSTAAHQTLTQVTTSIAADGVHGDIENGDGRAVAGCRAAWFWSAPGRGDPPLPVTFAQAGEIYSGRVEVRLLNRRVDQDACRDQAPAVSLTARSSLPAPARLKRPSLAAWGTLAPLDPRFPGS